MILVTQIEVIYEMYLYNARVNGKKTLKVYNLFIVFYSTSTVHKYVYITLLHYNMFYVLLLYVKARDCCAVASQILLLYPVCILARGLEQ